MNVQLDPNNPLRVRKLDNEESGSDEEFEDVNPQKKRKAVDATGYDEDSENDDELDSDGEPIGTVKAKDAAKEEQEDNDSDMFSDEEKQEEEKKPGKKGIELMDMDEFEKENMIQKAKHDNDDNEEDEDEDDSDNARTKEPQMDAFDLRKEMQEGAFTATGEYIEAQPTEPTLDEFSSFKKSDIRKAKLAKDAQDEKLLQKRRTRAADQEFSTERLLFKLIGVLQPVESPMEALQRYNKRKPKKKGKKVELSDDEKQVERERQEAITCITEYCESLSEQGIRDVYELEKEELMLKYREETGTPYLKPRDESTVQPPQDSDLRWEFRWVGDSSVHGPYTSKEMSYWKEAYFQDRVEVRPTGTPDFVHVSNVSF